MESQTNGGSPQIDTIVDEYANIPELIASDPQFQDDTVAEVIQAPSLEFIDDTVTEVAQPSWELIDDTVTEVALAPPSLEVTPSPLIRKWMQSQGYSLPESIYLQYQDKATDVLEHQTPPDKQPAVDDNLSLNPNPEMEMATDLNVVEAEEISLQETWGHSRVYRDRQQFSEKETQPKKLGCWRRVCLMSDSTLGDRIR